MSLSLLTHKSCGNSADKELDPIINYDIKYRLELGN